MNVPWPAPPLPLPIHRTYQMRGLGQGVQADVAVVAHPCAAVVFLCTCCCLALSSRPPSFLLLLLLLLPRPPLARDGCGSSHCCRCCCAGHVSPRLGIHQDSPPTRECLVDGVLSRTSRRSSGGLALALFVGWESALGWGREVGKVSNGSTRHVRMNPSSACVHPGHKDYGEGHTPWRAGVRPAVGVVHSPTR